MRAGIFVILATLYVAIATGRRQPPHVDDEGTEIRIRSCNSQSTPPGGRQQPDCQQNNTVSCKQMRVKPGACLSGPGARSGVSISCFFFQACITADLFLGSTSCTGAYTRSDVGPCDNDFSPVLPGCSRYACNATTYQEHKCFPHNADSDINVHKILSHLAQTSEEVDRDADEADQIFEPKNPGHGGKNKKKWKHHDNFFRGYERNCTKDAQCFTKPPVDFEQCTSIGGGASVISKLEIGEMRPRSDFKNCGWVVFSHWASDPLCMGKPDNEFAHKTGECQLGPDPFDRQMYSSSEINCFNKRFK